MRSKDVTKVASLTRILHLFVSSCNLTFRARSSTCHGFALCLASSNPQTKISSTIISTGRLAEI